MSVAYQGAPGAFGHQACLAFLPEEEPIAMPRFADVAAAVERGEVDFGMLPVENSYAGPVLEAQDVIARSSVRIVAEHVLPVRMHLMGLPGTTIDQVTVAVSHPVALAQCAETLAALGLAGEPAANTATAAQTLADPNRAVLASEAAADAYGLTILRRDVHDRPDNATRFVVLARGGR